MNAIAGQRPRQRLRHVLLADDVGQPARPVGAVQRRGHPVTLVRGCDAGDPPHTRQSPPALAAFRPWGIQQDDAARGVGGESTTGGATTGVAGWQGDRVERADARPGNRSGICVRRGG
jgi:hypothetical protein